MLLAVVVSDPQLGNFVDWRSNNRIIGLGVSNLSLHFTLSFIHLFVVVVGRVSDQMNSSTVREWERGEEMHGRSC